MGRHILIQDDNQTDTVGHVLGLDRIETATWAIQRPDGLYWIGHTRGLAPEPIFGISDPCTFISPESAQFYIDQMQRSTTKRAAFTDCRPSRFPLPVEAGDHVVCACGLMHEGDYCPTAIGHGAVL